MLNWFPFADEQWSLKNKDTYIHMDISFGNTCSQQCIMCNSNFSSKWLKHDLELNESNLLLPKKINLPKPNQCEIRARFGAKYLRENQYLIQ